MWTCGTKGEWDFVVDKGKLGRLVSISESSTLSDLCEEVRLAFGGLNMELSLSYWNTRFGFSEIGSKMPPYLIESDCGVRIFFKMLVDKSDRNLLVTFKSVEDGALFRTPVMDNKSKRAISESGYVHGGGITKPPIIDDDNGLIEEVEALEEQLRTAGKSAIEGRNDQRNKVGVVFRTPVQIAGKRKRAISVGESSVGESYGYFASMKKVQLESPEVIIDHSGLIDEVEAVEEQHRSNVKSGDKFGKFNLMESDNDVSLLSRNGKRVINIANFNLLDEDCVEELRSGDQHPNFNLIDEDDSSDWVDVDISEEEVRPKGYDTEFWKSLVDDIYGGSNAVEVMCSTDNVFDHVVRLGGDGERDQYCKVEQLRSGKNTNSVIHGQASSSGTQLPENRMADVPFRRNLNEVMDEEFDVEPLFDDTIYERSEIPDLDRDESDEEIYVGKTFVSKLDCQIFLAIYAIKNMFYFKQTRSNKEYLVVKYADVFCGWRVTAYELKDSSYYQIRKASLEHVCSIETRSQYTKLTSSKVIAAIYRSKFVDKDGARKPMDLQQLLLEELRLSSSYTKCWRAREAANEENNGYEEDGYKNLLKYLHMLKVANPGTVADVETEDDGLGGERFLYMFLSFGALILGFRRIRPAIVLDGTHLSGKYKGVLLTASGQDANFQSFPLAFAVMDSENDAAWVWFLKKLERIIADSPRIAIISDRANSIFKAVKEVFPKAKHGACIVHLSRNVAAKFKSKGLAKLVIQAVCAHKVGQFRVTYDNIKNKNIECGKYLEKSGVSTWSKAYFSGDRYNLMTSNIAESLNNALRKARSSPITELVMFIQSLLTRWFCARRKKSESHKGLVTPQVDKVLTNNLTHAKDSRVTCIGGWRYEVVGQFGERNNVDLGLKKCSCKVYDNLKIPCGHALIVGGVAGVPYGQLCSDFFTKSAWVEAYRGFVQAAEDPNGVDKPGATLNRSIQPQKTRRPSGRLKKKRIAYVGEFQIGDRAK